MSNIAEKHKIFKRRRIVLGPGHLGYKCVEQIGRLNYAKAEKPLEIHVHKSAIEICYLAKGRQIYRVKGRDYHLSGGDIYIAFPDEEHSTGRNPEEKSILYWVVVKLKGIKSILGLPAEQTRELRANLLKIQNRHFKGAARLREILDSIILACTDRNLKMKKLFVQNRISDFLLTLLECSRKPLKIDPRRNIQPVLDYIENNLTEKISINDLAKTAGLSPSRFKAKFKMMMGMPPMEYVLRRKINKAVEMLKTGAKSITDIAFDLDFSSSQYFATVFKRYTGKRPRDFKG